MSDENRNDRSKENEAGKERDKSNEKNNGNEERRLKALELDEWRKSKEAEAKAQNAQSQTIERKTQQRI